METANRTPTTRDGGTPGENTGTKGDKKVEPPDRTVATSDVDGGGEPIEDTDPKPTNKGI